MREKTEATIQVSGLDIIPTDALSDEPIPMSDGDISHDLDARLAVWTNFQFPDSDAFPSSSNNNPNPNADADDEDQCSFSPETHTASRSRHKTITVEDFMSGHFFGNVGTSTHSATSSHAGFHPHLHHDINTNANNNDMGDRNNIEHNHNNELFSFPPPGNVNLNSALIDPFLNPADIAVGASGYRHGAQPLPPLTIREPWEDRHPHRHLQQYPTYPVHMQPMTIDPATTSLGHRVTPSVSRLVIPAECEFTAPNSTIGDDEMDHDHYDHEDPSNSTGSPLYDEPGPPQLDASGKPIPYSPAEDKRRRNTIASARFRQKKKERDAAMHRKAKQLDEHVANLERECEILRKENKMLRGLLVDDIPTPNSATASTSTSTGNVDLSKSPLNGKNLVGVDAGASVVLLEELVRLLKANSTVLNNASGKATSTPPNGRTATTGKRKRGAGN